MSSLFRAGRQARRDRSLLVATAMVSPEGGKPNAEYDKLKRPCGGSTPPSLTSVGDAGPDLIEFDRMLPPF
jgi:hypothetical protein